MTRQYIGARYVPIIDGAWSAIKDYEPLTVVLAPDGNSYTSRTFVPAGTALTNVTYWALTGNYNAQVEAYRLEVLDLANKVQPDKTTIIYEEGNLKDAIEALTDGDTLIIKSGTYTINGASVTADDINIICDEDVVINNTSTGAAISITGDNVNIVNMFIQNVAGWFPNTDTPIYGTINVEGNNAKFVDVKIDYVNKAGIYVKGDAEFYNCSIDAHVPSTVYPAQSINNQIYEVYIYASSNINFKNCKFVNCNFRNSIVGIYFGDLTYPATEFSISVEGCYFEGMFDHGIYCNGGQSGRISESFFKDCNDAITMLGSYHSIEGNTIYSSNEHLSVAGLSLREAHHCSIIGNIISGEGFSGSSGIDLQNLSGNPEPNTTIKDVIIADNVIDMTGNINPVRIGYSGQTETIENVVISGNIIKSEVGSNGIFLTINASTGSSIKISDNIFEAKNLANNFIASISSACNAIISNNEFISDVWDYDADTRINILNGIFSGTIEGNKVINKGTGSNITSAFIRMTSGTNKIRFIGNDISTLTQYLNNIGSIAASEIEMKGNTSSDASHGTITTTATGDGTIVNKNCVLGISNLILNPASEADSVKYSHVYVEMLNNRVNFYTDAAESVDFEYTILI